MSKKEKEQKRRFKPKKTILILSTLMIATVISAVMAAELSGFHIPMTATPTNPPIEISVTIGETSWTNGTAYDWETVDAGTTYTETMQVKNEETTRDASAVYIITPGLPLGWTLTWTANNTGLTAGSSVSGTLSLTTPAEFSDTTPQSWDMWIKADP